MDVSRIMQMQAAVGNRRVAQLMRSSQTIQRKLDWQTVNSTLGAMLESHDLKVVYQQWWKDGTARRISEKVGNLEDTDKHNVKRRLADHEDVKPVLMKYRMGLDSKQGPQNLSKIEVDEEDVDNEQLQEVFNAFQNLLFYHATKYADSVRETGLDPNYGGTEGGLTDERSLAAKKATNMAAAKKKVFVSRKYTEAKQYADGNDKNVVMLIVPQEFQADLELDPDSQFGVKGGDHLKGTVAEDSYPNWWGIMYLLNEIKSKEAKTNFYTLWTILIKKGLIKL